MLGAGTLLPHPERSSAAWLFDPGEHPVLVECGTGTLHGLARHGIDWRRLAGVVVTHFHTDHVSDLAPLIGALRFDGRREAFVLAGPAGLRRHLDGLARVYGGWLLEPGFPLEVRELGPGDAAWTGPGGVAVDVCRTPHTDESIALTCRAPDGARVGYTGDTGPSPSVARHLAGVDLLIAECALDDPPDMDRHLSPSSVIELIGRAEPRGTVLTHVYPPSTPAEVAGRVGRAVEAPVFAGSDGLRLLVRPGATPVASL